MYIAIALVPFMIKKVSKILQKITENINEN
jgi:hypothetical protein